MIGSMNRRHRDEALDETNAAVPSDYANDAYIESNCLTELEPSRTSRAIPGFMDRIYGNSFRIWKWLNERIPAIYILLGFEDILFFRNYLIFKIKINSGKG
jgi:hypothetical protein